MLIWASFHLTNTAPLSFGKIKAGFWVILLHGRRLLLGHPYYEPILWFMNYSKNNHTLLRTHLSLLMPQHTGMKSGALRYILLPIAWLHGMVADFPLPLWLFKLPVLLSDNTRALAGPVYVAL